MPKKPKGPIAQFFAPVTRFLKKLALYSVVAGAVAASLFFGSLYLIAKIFS